MTTPARASTRRMLVTSALPYANGDIHLGHLVEYIQTDVWVRFQKLCGHEVHYVCADDTHGTPVMLRAEALGISPEALIDKVWKEHTRDFLSFGIAFDHYYTTHSEENRELAHRVFHALQHAGLIERRVIEQMYDPERRMFLPDRFIRGTCPRCGAGEQYGDACEACGATYNPTDLIAPRSVVSGAVPVRRSSEHYFFRLSDPRCVGFLRNWALADNRLQSEARNKLREWLGQDVRPGAGDSSAPPQSADATAAPSADGARSGGADDSGAGEAKLADWDISRDAPYFGFEIPGAPGKYFYVWLDAPIGYYASFLRYARDRGLDFDAFTGADSTCEQYHFIGKDILYFHTLFWPAMLHFAGFRPPTQVFAHGFLTVDGHKMSKSRGTFINAHSYIAQGLNPEWLRYYFAAKLNASMEDLDLNLDDFVARVNADLVGKLVNIAARCAGFLARRFDNVLGPSEDEALASFAGAWCGPERLAALYAGREYSRAMREIMGLCDAVNQYIDQRKPWELVKHADRGAELQAVCSTALRAFAHLMRMLQPVLPATSAHALDLLGANARDWESISLVGDAGLPPGHRIAPMPHLMARVERKQIDALLEANKEQRAVQQGAGSTIGLEDFAKVDLRLGRIVAAEAVQGSTRLMRLVVDLGEPAPRTIFSGIREHVAPERLLGRTTVVVANLAPRKMSFGTSEGMLLTATDVSGQVGGIYLLDAEDGATPGMRLN